MALANFYQLILCRNLMYFIINVEGGTAVIHTLIEFSLYTLYCSFCPSIRDMAMELQDPGNVKASPTLFNLILSKIHILLSPNFPLSLKLCYILL